MGERRQVQVGAHVRDGVAVGDYTQSRPARRSGIPAAPTDRGVHGGALHGIVEDMGSYAPTASEWGALIAGRDGSSPPTPEEARRFDGSFDVGRRELVVSVNHRFTHHHDDQATEKVEEIPSEFEAREHYRIPVPDGAHVDYAAVREAVVAHTAERFDPLVADGTYGGVEVRTVMVAEWEVTGDADPKKLWRRRRETWEDGSLDG